MTSSFRRAYEIASPPHAENDRRQSQAPFYERLMQITITNSYYKKQQDSGTESVDFCPDLIIKPTTASAGLMKQMGLLFKSQPTGCSIAYDCARPAKLVNYLKRQGNRRVLQSKEDGKYKRGVAFKSVPGLYWTWLSFTLQSTNPEFQNFTDIPLKPLSNYNFYVNNQFAWAKSRHAEATPSELESLNIDAIWNGSELPFLKVVPANFEAQVPLDANEVYVYDMAGKLVQLKHRWHMNQQRVKVAADAMFLDLCQLPEDRYTLCCGERDSQPEEVLFTNTGMVGFMNLLLCVPSEIASPNEAENESEPEDQEDGTKTPEQGAYPVKLRFHSEDIEGITQELEFKNPRVEPKHYQLKFQARKTYWIYIIIRQSGKRYDEWKITKRSVDPREDLEFHRVKQLPPELQLPGALGQVEAKFISSCPLALMLYENPWLQLHGKPRKKDAKEKIIVEHLPVPSASQIIATDQSVELETDEPQRTSYDDQKPVYSRVLVYV